MRKSAMCWLGAVVVGAITSLGWAKEVVEKFDDGTVHLRYRTDAKDRKDGEYTEFFPGGKTHVRGNFLLDKKSGAWTTFSETGKPLELATYKNDQLDGPYQWNWPSGLTAMRGNYRAGILEGSIATFDDKGNPKFQLTYPIGWDAVCKAWKAWNPVDRPDTEMLEEPVPAAPYKAGKMAPECQQSALKYVMLYRFMSGLPVAGMSIDPDYVEKCQYGAVIVHKVGHLTHTPDKPADMDDSFYKLAYTGTSHSNLSQGRRNLLDSIDDYMDDSDESNIQRVGHRQWILNPGMLKTGFGYCDGFSSLYSFDLNNHNDKNWLYIAYPGPGFYPHSMLHDDAAWSLSLNTQKCKVGDAKSLLITVSELDEHFAEVETSTARIVAQAMCPDGAAWPCIIFQPGIKHLETKKYVVSVKGIRALTGAPAPLSYLVDVRDMPREDGK